jgi:hypothetical protein
MADIIGSVLGTSGTQTQETQPDAVARALNLARLQQLEALFAGAGPILQFGHRNYDISDTTPETQALIDSIMRVANAPVDYSNIPTIGQYRAGFAPATQAYTGALRGLDTATQLGINESEQNYLRGLGVTERNLAGALGRSYADYSTGLQGAGSAYTTNIAAINDAYNAAIARGDYDYARAIINSEANLGRGLGFEQASRQRALDLGLGATGNYISNIATPRIMQELSLAGLERGGGISDAIARATAEVAIPYLQSIEQLYGTNTANLIAQTAAQQGQTSTAAVEGNRALGSQLLAGRAQAGGQYQQNVTQLAQAMMANNITLEQAGIAANSALGQQLMQAQATLRQQQQQGITSLAGTYIPAATSFAQSIPAAAQTLSMLPIQMRAGQSALINAAAPLADYQRALREADYLRRQGLFQTVYTGIPFSPGSTTAQTSETGNLFNQLGSFLTSFGTLGTKGGTGTGLT